MMRLYTVVALFIYCMMAFHALSSVPPPCPLYQAITSTGGVGVFAGQDFLKDDPVEFAPTFYTSPEAYTNNIVGDYVVNHNSTHGSLHGGYSLVMNHCDRPNIRYPDENEWMRAKRNITKGEELCINYGKSWWNLRGYTKLEPMNLQFKGNEASIIPGCPQLLAKLVAVDMTESITDDHNENNGADGEEDNRLWKKDDVIEGNFRNEGHWYRGKIEAKHENGTFDILYDDGDVEKGVSEELIRLAHPLKPPSHMKVVASVDIPLGTTIEVSRSLIIPRRFWDNDQYDLKSDEYPNDVKHRIWRIMDDDSHSIGLLNYGLGAYYRVTSNSSHRDLMSNHSHLMSNASFPNVVYREYKETFRWSDERVHACVPATLIEFIAIHDIMAGTELVVDLNIDTDSTRFGERISKIRLGRRCIDHFISSDAKIMLNGTSYHPLLRKATFESKDVKNATLFWLNPGMPPNTTTQHLASLERWGDLNVGEIIRVNTYVGHTWIVQVNGSTIREWHIPKDATYRHDVLRFELYEKDVDIDEIESCHENIKGAKSEEL